MDGKTITKEKMAKFKKHLDKLMDKRKKRLEEGRKNYTPPRYDDVYFEGLQYLDSLDCPSEFDKVVTKQFWELI